MSNRCLVVVALIKMRLILAERYKEYTFVIIPRYHFHRDRQFGLRWRPCCRKCFLLGRVCQQVNLNWGYSATVFEPRKRVWCVAGFNAVHNTNQKNVFKVKNTSAHCFFASTYLFRDNSQRDASEIDWKLCILFLTLIFEHSFAALADLALTWLTREIARISAILVPCTRTAPVRFCNTKLSLTTACHAAQQSVKVRHQALVYAANFRSLLRGG